MKPARRDWRGALVVVFALIAVAVGYLTAIHRFGFLWLFGVALLVYIPFHVAGEALGGALSRAIRNRRR